MTATVQITKSQTPTRRNRLVWLILLIGVCIPAVFVNSAFSESLNQMLPETIPFPSTYNKKASGWSAAYELSRRLGIETKQWQSPYRKLIEDKKIGGTLVIIFPWESLNPADVDSIVEWVKRGNDLVYLDFINYRTSHTFLKELGLHMHVMKEVKDADFATEASVPETGNAMALRLSADTSVDGGEPIVRSGNDTLLTWARVGKGRCLVGGVPQLCANKYIADANYRKNFQFLMNWFAASKQPILFDEKCHGYSSGTNVWFFILRSPVGFVLLQLLMIVFVALISLNQRFGQPVPVSNARKISNLEFIDGLASTYQRARARDAAWAMLFTPFKARLCRVLGVAPDAPVEKLAQVWAEHTGKPEADCLSFLQKAQSALDRTMTDQELAGLVASADAITADSRDLQAARRVIGA